MTPLIAARPLLTEENAAVLTWVTDGEGLYLLEDVKREDGNVWLRLSDAGDDPADPPGPWVALKERTLRVVRAASGVPDFPPEE